MDSHESHTATDHDEIRKRRQARDGEPAIVTVAVEGDEPGVLRINFPGYEEEGLEAITWEEFFEKFDGGESRFCKCRQARGRKAR